MKDNEKKNEIMVFDNPEFGQVRSIEIDGESWMVGKDVATALGYSNPRNALATHVDDEDKATVATYDSSGIYQIETEAGISPLMQVAMIAAQFHSTDAGTYSGER